MANNKEWGLKGPSVNERIYESCKYAREQDAKDEAERAALEREIANIDKEIDRLHEKEERRNDRIANLANTVLQAQATLEAAKILAQSRNNDGGTVTLTNEQFQQLLDAAKSKY